MPVYLHIKGKTPPESELATTTVALLAARGRVGPLTRIRERGICIFAALPVVPGWRVMLRRGNRNRSCGWCRRQNCEITVSLNGDNEAGEADYTEVADW